MGLSGAMMSFALFPVGELLESRAQDQSRPETVSRKAAPKKCDPGRLSGQAFRGRLSVSQFARTR